MTVSVVFAGATYVIPEEDDRGWADLTAYLVALSDASVGSVDQKSFRVATSTPVTVSASDDYAIGVNVGSASVVNLPAGVTGQIYTIFDGSGDAANNNITINGDSGQEISGRASYVIRSNYGAVTLQFGVSEWSVLSARELTYEQNETNLSVIDASVPADNTGASVSNDESCTVTLIGKAHELLISVGDRALKVVGTLNSDIVSCVYDPEELFLSADSGSGVYVSKSGATWTIKNKYGVANIKIRVTLGQVASATAWS